MDDPRTEQLMRTGERRNSDADPVLVTATIEVCISTERGCVGDPAQFVRDQLTVLGADDWSVDKKTVEVQDEK